MPGAARDDIAGAIVSVNLVRTAFTAQYVGSSAAEELIATVPAGEDVASRLPRQVIVSAAADKHIRGSGASESVALLVAQSKGGRGRSCCGQEQASGAQ